MASPAERAPNAEARCSACTASWMPLSSAATAAAPRRLNMRSSPRTDRPSIRGDDTASPSPSGGAPRNKLLHGLLSDPRLRVMSRGLLPRGLVDRLGAFGRGQG